MGQKVHPYGFRLGYTKPWKSRWFVEKDYDKLLLRGRPLSRRALGGLGSETGKPIEPKFEPSLGLIEDTEKKVSGPIYVRGGIPVVSADGKTYEIRNRVTLCRCGRSDNKPFCNGSHAA